MRNNSDKLSCRTTSWTKSLRRPTANNAAFSYLFCHIIHNRNTTKTVLSKNTTLLYLLPISLQNKCKRGFCY